MVCTLLIAPQTTEFGAKVALLGGLVLMTTVRYFFDGLFPENASEPAGIDTLLGRLVRPGGSGLGPRRTFIRGAVLGSVFTLIAAAVVAAGAPARQTAQAAMVQPPSIDVEVDSSTLRDR